MYVLVPMFNLPCPVLTLVVGLFLYSLSFIGRKKRMEEKKAWKKYYREKEVEAEVSRRSKERFDAWLKDHR